MKKLIVLALMAFFCLRSEALAKECMEVNADGMVRLVQSGQHWRSPTPDEALAIHNPGQEIPVGPSVLTAKRNPSSDFFHVTFVKTFGKVIVYKDGCLVEMAKEARVNVSRGISPYTIFFIVAVALMAMSNILRQERHKTFLVFAAIVSCVIAAEICLCICDISGTRAAFVFTFPFLASLLYLSGLCLDRINIKVGSPGHKLLSALFYVIVLTSMFV